MRLFLNTDRWLYISLSAFQIKRGSRDSEKRVFLFFRRGGFKNRKENVRERLPNLFAYDFDTDSTNAARVEFPDDFSVDARYESWRESVHKRNCNG